MNKEFDNLEDIFTSKEHIHFAITNILNDIFTKNINQIQSSTIDENFEYFKEQLNKNNYLITKIGEDKITKDGIYQITKQ